MNIVFVFVSTMAAFLGCLIALRQIITALKKRWLDDEAHTRAQRENTIALEKLTASMDKVMTTLNDHERRLIAGSL